MGPTQACKCLTKAFVVYFKVTQHFFDERKKSSKALNQTSQRKAAKSKPILPECETEVLTIYRDVWFLELNILHVVYRP